MILRKSRDNDPVFNFIMGAGVVCINIFLIYLKLSYNREMEIQSRTDPSRSIEESMENGVFAGEVRIIDPNERVAPYVGEMWVEKQSEEKYSWLFIKHRIVHSDHRIVLASDREMAKSFSVDLCSENRECFGIHGRGDDVFLCYEYSGSNPPDTLKMFVRPRHERTIIDTVTFVL